MSNVTFLKANGKRTDDRFRAAIAQTRTCFDEMASDEFAANLAVVAGELGARLASGGTVFWCGNGGSASDALHLAAELIGRFGQPGRGWPSVALTADSAVLTSASNDFGYESVFERQVAALVGPLDAVVGISTSGVSRNVIAAIAEARVLGALTIALTGPNDSPLADAAQLVIRAPGASPSEIQTCHIAIGQLLCEAAIELAESFEERRAA